jgi:hypothetical protein
MRQAAWLTADGLQGTDKPLTTGARDHIMKDTNQPHELDQSAAYQIKVQERLDEHWMDWFNGLTITFESEEDGATITTLTGAVADQAVLRGILCKLWDLNLTLISVTRYPNRDGI